MNLTLRGRRNRLTSSRKGNVVMDLIMFILGISIFATVFILGWQAFSEMKDDVLAEVTLNESKTVVNDVESRYPSVFDGFLIFVLFGLWAAGVVSAFVSDQHPLIFGFLMIAVIFVIIAGAFISNYWEEIFEDSEFDSIKDDFPKTNFALTHLLEISIVVAVSIALALMGKNRLG